jgi:plastocyanin
MKQALLLLSACALLVPPPSSRTAPRAPGHRADEPGTIRGKALFLGEAPRRRKVDMGSDPSCHALHAEEPLRDESLLVGDAGGIANVFLYVSKGLEGRKFEPPREPVVLDQKGCCYVPHVLGVQVGQRLVIRNGDPVTHNVHSFAKKNKAFNQSQQSGGKDLEQVFDKEEVLMPIKCDIHGWMSTYLGVVEHPFFAVTAADGSFEIRGLPPGEYTLSAKHEALGAQKASVTVGAGGVAEANFSFAEQ